MSACTYINYVREWWVLACLETYTCSIEIICEVDIYSIISYIQKYVWKHIYTLWNALQYYSYTDIFETHIQYGHANKVEIYKCFFYTHKYV